MGIDTAEARNAKTLVHFATEFEVRTLIGHADDALWWTIV
jgi:hypothetical protein